MESSRQRATRLISELYGDWLATLPDTEFQAEVRQLDKRTGLVSATKELLEIRKQLKEGVTA
jgi:multidrug resistance efflux pump